MELGSFLHRVHNSGDRINTFYSGEVHIVCRQHEIMLFTVTLCLTFLHLSPYLKHFSFASSGQLLYSSKHLLLGAGVVPLLVGVVVAVPLLVSVVSLPENVAAHIGLN